MFGGIRTARRRRLYCSIVVGGNLISSSTIIKRTLLLAIPCFGRIVPWDLLPAATRYIQNTNASHWHYVLTQDTVDSMKSTEDTAATRRYMHNTKTNHWDLLNEEIENRFGLQKNDKRLKFRSFQKHPKDPNIWMLRSRDGRCAPWL